VALAALLTSGAEAGGHRLSAGAFSVMGGANPVSFGSPAEYSYTYINNSRDREFVLGIVPGIAYAVRFEPSERWAISVGAALGYGTASPFVGPYAGFAFEFWCPLDSFCLTLDYRTATAVYSYKKAISGVSSIALGGTLWSR